METVDLKVQCGCLACKWWIVTIVVAVIAFVGGVFLGVQL